MGEFIRQCIPTDSRSLLTLNPSSRTRDKPAIGLHCHLNYHIIVYFGIDAFDGRPAIVNGHHPAPDLLLDTDVMVQLTHVLYEFVVPTT